MTDDFYSVNWPTNLYVSAAAFGVWAFILTVIAAF
jgi:hypothetical protein